MKTVEEPKEEKKVRFSLHIPKGSNIRVNLDKLGLGDKQAVLIEGKVTSVSEDEYDEGKSFSMEVNSVDFTKKPSTIKEDAEEVTEQRKIKG